MTDLLQAWHTLLARHSSSPRVDDVGAALLGRWAEPHRSYHDLSHLRGILSGVDALEEFADDPDAVRLAAWYHDAVYAGQSDDEENSALLAESDLADLGVAPAFVAEVGRLVRVTITHDPAADDHNGQVLSDADLAVLAVPPADYQHNTARVRAEYRHVSDADFALWRGRMIAAMLAGPSLYRTDAGRRLWEDAARTNLKAELAALSG
ncbi:metal-dependent phosphohydrolase [Mycolicibacterium mucogenicum]|uniref:Metal-dependent phosphohydrolase n=1 Tax=Mycolicibacterium mucogenicum TaxID=56689 RepID=A0A1A3GPZ1_MYCMU|nr:metal-dependent phosphohydrolase [Mycolicibacterium mucogenicum]OBJ37409.1 metal-dependent phosphohydrolase [Mycolicibacterium mucogenicum]